MAKIEQEPDASPSAVLDDPPTSWPVKGQIQARLNEAGWQGLYPPWFVRARSIFFLIYALIGYLRRLEITSSTLAYMFNWDKTLSNSTTQQISKITFLSYV